MTILLNDHKKFYNFTVLLGYVFMLAIIIYGIAGYFASESNRELQEEQSSRAFLIFLLTTGIIGVFFAKPIKLFLIRKFNANFIPQVTFAYYALGYALCEIAALYGMIIFVLTGNLWIYALLSAASFIGIYFNFPTKSEKKEFFNIEVS